MHTYDRYHTIFIILIRKKTLTMRPFSVLAGRMTKGVVLTKRENSPEWHICNICHSRGNLLYFFRQFEHFCNKASAILPKHVLQIIHSLAYRACSWNAKCVSCVNIIIWAYNNFCQYLFCIRLLSKKTIKIVCERNIQQSKIFAGVHLYEFTRM